MKTGSAVSKWLVNNLSVIGTKIKTAFLPKQDYPVGFNDDYGYRCVTIYNALYPLMFGETVTHSDVLDALNAVSHEYMTGYTTYISQANREILDDIVSSVTPIADAARAVYLENGEVVVPQVIMSMCIERDREVDCEPIAIV